MHERPFTHNGATYPMHCSGWKRRTACDPGLAGLKFDNLLDPVRRQPRFREIERQLKFPD
ncbi:MAG: hypothetical protein NVS1B6_00830 [Steroidobacteraceae bacterium]